MGVELYLAYFFGLYALAGVVTWATLLHIAVLGLAVRALLLGMPTALSAGVDIELGPRLLRRTTVAFPLLVAPGARDTVARLAAPAQGRPHPPRRATLTPPRRAPA